MLSPYDIDVIPDYHTLVVFVHVALDGDKGDRILVHTRLLGTRKRIGRDRHQGK